MFGQVFVISCLVVVNYLHARDFNVSKYATNPRGCTVPFASLPYPEQPLILIPGSEKFWYPQDETRKIVFKSGASVELVCRDGFGLFPEKQSITIECMSDETFRYDGTTYPMQDLACTSNWVSSTRKTQETCYNGSVIVNVGFELSANRWVNVFDVCYDEMLYHTHFVRHHMNRANGGYQTGYPRPSWNQGAYFPGIIVNNLYRVEKQRQTIALILSSQSRANELVSLTTAKGIYMSRGHMAARADFVYGTEQNATFWFLNAAPQWQNFNGVNWEKVESSIRNFIGQRDMELTVYSGTYGVQKQADGNGDYREIWLDFDPTEGRQRIPAPMLYYKILHDERNNAGIVIVGVNNVHVPTDHIVQGYVMCKDIGDQVDWIDWQRTNIAKGYCYACEVNEFNAAIGNPYPQLNVTRVLTSGAKAQYKIVIYVFGVLGIGIVVIFVFRRYQRMANCIKQMWR